MTALAAVVTGVAVLPVLAELVVRRLESRLPLHLMWQDVLTTGKWHQLRRIRRGRPVDVVVIGSSEPLMALDPLVLVPPPARCYNAALYRGVPTVASEWLADVVLPATRPKLVVWGLSIADLNDAGRLHLDVYQRFASSPGRDRSWQARVRRAACARLALCRQAGSLRHPRRMLRVLGGRDLGSRQLRRVLGPMGKGIEYAEFTEYRLSDEKATFIREQVVENFQMGGEQFAALRRGAAAVAASGARLLLLEMPTTSEFVDMFPHGPQLEAEGRQAMRALAEELGVPFEPLPPERLPKEWFADCLHLNGVGMRAWSQRLAPVVAEELKAAAR